jgi:hypothetical protein
VKGKRFTGDSLEALRRADPLDPREALTDPSGARARALFQEVTSMDATDKAPVPQRRQPLLRRVALGVAAVAVVAAAAGGAYALLRDAEEAIVGGEAVGSGDPMAMCVQYTDEMLADQEIAFDGTLVSASADGSEAVFEVHRWFKGGDGAEVTLSAQGLIGGDSLALVGASLETGQRYLVSGTDGFVWACGFTLTYDTALAEHWAELFGA